MDLSAEKNLRSKLQKCGFNDIASLYALKLNELEEVLQTDLTNYNYIDLASLLPSYRKLQFEDGNVETNRLATGCKQIDAILQGGFPTGRINEIYGSSGSGKTQFCMQLLIRVQLPKHIGGFQKSAVYIGTEKPFPSSRFHHLSNAFSEKLDYDIIDFQDNVYIEACFNLARFNAVIFDLLPKLMQRVQVGLIIIDSIAAIYRGDHDSISYRERSVEFYKIVTQLRKLMKKYDAVTICINQVRDNIETNEIEPCLGHSWSNLIAQRFCISRTSSHSVQREFRVIKSYELSKQSAVFDIQSNGIQ